MKQKAMLTMAVTAVVLIQLAMAAPPLPEFKSRGEIRSIRAEQAAQRQIDQTENASPAAEAFFYTGKLYISSLEQYAFLFRKLDPELCRWSSADPSGFPDGANHWLYITNRIGFGIDPDGLQFLHFNGSSITVWSGSGYNSQSGGSIDWGTAGTSWTGVSGGSGGASPIPNGWWQTSAMTLGGIQSDFYPERSVMEGDILFAGTMSTWDTSSGPGYGDYAFQAYGGVNRLGYDSAASGGTYPNIVEYKVGLSGIQGNSNSIHKGHRIHPTMGLSTSGCIGISDYAEAQSFQTFIANNMGIELLVE